MVPQTLCESASSSGRNIVVLFCVVIWCTFGPLHVAPANASQVTSGIVPSLFLASPQRGWHRQNVQGIHYGLAVCTNACVTLAWQRAICLSVPLLPGQRCHHAIAGDRCPGTSSWLCPGKKRTISDKSSGLAVVDGDGSETPRLIAQVTPSLQAGTVPVGWHATAGVERNKQSNTGQRTGFYAIHFQRS